MKHPNQDLLEGVLMVADVMGIVIDAKDKGGD